MTQTVIVRRILRDLATQTTPRLSWKAEDWPEAVWHALERAAKRSNFDIPASAHTPHALAAYLAGHPGWLDALQRRMRAVGYILPALPPL